MSDPLTPDRLEEIRRDAVEAFDGASTTAGAHLLALLAEVDRLRGERQKLIAFMDSVRDAARDRNPDGATLLDFMACWNEQYESQLKRLRAALASLAEEPDDSSVRAFARDVLEGRR